MVSNKERFEAFCELLKEAGAIKDNINVQPLLPEIIARLDSGTDGFCVMTPLEETVEGLVFEPIFVYPPTATPRSLKIYPFFPDDAWIHEVLLKSGLARGTSYGAYTRPMHQVFINMQMRETLKAGAAIFLHELGHAREAVLNKHAFTDYESPLEDRILEEMKMRTFDYKLALALGGPAYQTEFDRGVYLMKKFRKKKSPERQFPEFEGRGSALSHCFGEHPDPWVARMRDDLFQLYCDLAAADRNLSSSDAERFKFQRVKAFAGNLQF